MARSWVGLTILACLPCMEMLRSREARHWYVNFQYAGECYDGTGVSSKNSCQIRPGPPLHHKISFAYQWWSTGIQLLACCSLTRRDAPRKTLESVCHLLECRLQRLKTESTLEKNLDKLLEGDLL